MSAALTVLVTVITGRWVCPSGMSTMSGKPGPEWISFVVVTGSVYTEGEWHPARVRIGWVEMPGGGGRRFASQADVEPARLFIFPPAMLARIMGEARRGIRG